MTAGACPARFAAAFLVGFGACGPGGAVPAQRAGPDTSRAVLPEIAYLARVMDQFHSAYYVYSDADAAGNHFAARGWMSSAGGIDSVAPMDEAWTERPFRGATCIRATYRNLRGGHWGGWYWLNGVLWGDEKAPRLNWGDVPQAGVDLRGATRLRFVARGAAGGERVEFFALGVGWDPDSGRRIARFPDSSPKVSTGTVTLSADWREYSIPLPAGIPLGYVLGGFGWVATAAANGRDIAFFLDEIRYDLARPAEPRFLLSYVTEGGAEFDRVTRNVSFVYDDAVAAIAFLAAGQTERARLIADALVYAQRNDRHFSDGRIRNAYAAGDLALPPGWSPRGRSGAVRMPGWYDPDSARWNEDLFHVSTHTGNVAWAMLALLSVYEALGGAAYLDAARQMGEWVEANARDASGAGGYTGGVEGWEADQTKLTYKATEHNIDLVPAFQRLFQATGDARWRERAEHARRFVLAMWDPGEGKFWTGTDPDGVTINRAVVPVDIQAWAVLALRGEGRPYWRALDYAERHIRVGQGYDFSHTDRDAVWYEGTAQMAAAYALTGDTLRHAAIVRLIDAARDPGGGVYAAERDGLTTGFYLPRKDDGPWLYFRRLHVGATGWAALAKLRVNPFWFPQ